MPVIIKPLNEPVIVPLSFATAATAVNNLTVTAHGLVPGAGPIAVNAVIDAGLAQLTVSGGADGERYDVVVSVNHAVGGPTERTVTIAPIDPAWTMSDGTASWLSIIEFAAKFGLDETVRATDGEGAGVMDRSFLIGALQDAQAEAEANLAGRYALPLSGVPALLKTVVADLARARLYPRGWPDGVETAVKAARDTLKRLSSGAMSLPGVAGIAVEADSGADDSISYTTGARAYPNGLSEY